MSAADATWDAYRRWGYLAADLDWLGRLEPIAHPDLPAEGEAVETASATYCGTLAAEFAHIPDPERREWMQQRMEGAFPDPDRKSIVDQLMRAAIFEQFLQTGYLGNKRFSIEGLESLIPLLNEMLQAAVDHDSQTAILAMSHRGRLNVMAHVVGNDYTDLLGGFEDVDPRAIMGAGDVKYHLGATGTFEGRDGGSLAIHLVSNPSHLEAVNPVMMGRARAKQDRLGGDRERHRVVPILMHGDAAFAGQGVTAETLNMAGLSGYTVGGTIHVIANNLIGFTTEPEAEHTTRFASDLAKRLPIPVLHVNAEDPEAVVRAAKIAADYRYQFASDVVVDLIGFRRHGHSEVDDPTVTQPTLYAAIKQRPPLWETYVDKSGVDRERIETMAEGIRAELSTARDQASALTEIPLLRNLPTYWDGYVGGDWNPEQRRLRRWAVDRERDHRGSGLTLALDRLRAHRIAAIHWDQGAEAARSTAGPQWLQRREMAAGGRRIDYGMAEFLAYSSLVADGTPVRISGQDSRRGTFSHRHFIQRDVETSAEFCALQHVAEDQARFEIYDSPLSEAAVVGFEYGYSRDYPEALVAWEAQFGDFANGAQVMFDQFVSAGEDKWGLLSGLVVLLPHGFEGQGPEHSSARLERYLQLAAEDAIQVAQPSTAAQHFHLLRRQALRRWRKPLIVCTPKSMLRAAPATSNLEAFNRDGFLNVMPEREVEQAGRVLIATGKLVHELRAARKDRKRNDVAIVAVEQLYPFPDEELRAELDRFGDARDVVWIQEEPANQGALFFVLPRIERLTRGRPVRTIKRSASASPATGSLKAHEMEQKALIDLAFS